MCTYYMFTLSIAYSVLLVSTTIFITDHTHVYQHVIRYTLLFRLITTYPLVGSATRDMVCVCNIKYAIHYLIPMSCIRYTLCVLFSHIRNDMFYTCIYVHIHIASILSCI